MTKKTYHMINITLVLILLAVSILQFMTLGTQKQEMYAITCASAIFTIVAGLGALYTGISYEHSTAADIARRGWEPAAILLWLIFQTAYLRYLITGGSLILQVSAVIEFLILLLLLISSFLWKSYSNSDSFCLKNS